ncbi:MAG: GHMP kinase [Algicola sp.]|nr:GHMP kinase [Algicola sp.]
MTPYYSHGKLLISGEYLVLDGALALAVPTKFGQSLTVTKTSDDSHLLKWRSLDNHGSEWYTSTFDLSGNSISRTTKKTDPITDRLLQILNATKQLNPEFLATQDRIEITTTLEFPKNWGLGTSSTLINNIASWAGVDPYRLLALTFGGSGYDIACAQSDQSLTYQLNNRKQPLVNTVHFNPSFKQQLYFIHLNQKQNSRDGIAKYRTNKGLDESAILKINRITNQMVQCKSLETFRTLMEDHESIISKVIKTTSVKQRLFSDFQGSIKSLGAWGGDFIMTASEQDPTNYFLSKGYKTILSYSEMIMDK